MTVKRLLSSVLNNIEESGWWVSGRFRDPDDSHLFVEFSFEDALQLPNRYWIEPSCPIIYFGLHDRRHTVAEFMVGRWPHRPQSEEIVMCVAQIIFPLRNYRPLFVHPMTDPSVYADLARTHLHAL